MGDQQFDRRNSGDKKPSASMSLARDREGSTVPIYLIGQL
jgi:hypothetical protein